LGSDKTGVYAKLGAVGGIIFIIILSVISGESPIDVVFNLFKDIFVFLFFVLVFLSPLLLLGYIFIICFTNVDTTFSMSFSEVTKNRLASIMEGMKRDTPAPKKKKQAKPHKRPSK